MKQKITVIGGSGFVGTNLCHHLSLKQNDFEIIDLKMSNQFSDKCKIADVRDINTLRKTITGDIVINLAAVHRDDVRDKSEYKLTNVEGAKNIATVCTEKKIKKILFTSTVAVYGFAKPGTDENGAINPFNEYGRTKYEAEEKLREWEASGDNSLMIIRPTVIFGEGNRGNVYNLLQQIASGRFVMVGKGENKKSMAYIGNIVSFLEFAIKQNVNGVYNFVDTPDLTMNDLVKLVRNKILKKVGVGVRLPYWFGLIFGYVADLVTALTGKKLAVSSIRVKKFTSSTEFQSRRLGELNFTPPFTLEEGLQLTLKSEFIAPSKKPGNFLY